jgi:hypothetical protein
LLHFRVKVFLCNSEFLFVFLVINFGFGGASLIAHGIISALPASMVSFVCKLFCDNISISEILYFFANRDIVSHGFT